MTASIKFKKSVSGKNDTVVLGVYADKKLSAAASALDKDSGGLISRTLKNNAKFSGKAGETIALNLPEKAGYERAIIFGLGKRDELMALDAENAGGKLYASLSTAGAIKADFLLDGLKDGKKLKLAELAAYIGAGLKLRSYKFDRYKAADKNAKPFVELNIIGDAKGASALFDHQNNVADGVFTARNLVNEPPNELNPPSYADFIKKELAPLGVKVEILDEKKMQALGMGAILAVGMGSANKPRMVIMQWNGAGKGAKTKPVALVGKGVTFDTGGISIKPGAGMDEMKMDMGGSAAVVGTIKALALSKAKVNVVGVVGLAENMPSHDAYRPGDIIKSYSGKTIEVLNTDAEGRLVLADCLTYVQQKYKPEILIDLATLTGAMMVALGHEYCGTFANDDKLWSGLEKASAATGEKLWRMPLDPAWKKDMESTVADLQNLGKTGRWAGACTAAGFLEHFIEDGVLWAHMDIAGTAYIKADRPTVPKFGTGFGVRVLERFITENYG